MTPSDNARSTQTKAMANVDSEHKAAPANVLAGKLIVFVAIDQSGIARGNPLLEQLGRHDHRGMLMIMAMTRRSSADQRSFHVYLFSR